MASKNKTEHLALNLWESTDRPQRGDFNSDNLIVDEALGTHLEDTNLHLTAEEKVRVQRPVKITGYQGNGQAEATITLDAVPTGVIVYCDTIPIVNYDSASECTKIYSAVVFYGAGSTKGAELAGKVLKVKQDTSAADGVMCCLNESGRQYKVAVIR